MLVRRRVTGMPVHQILFEWLVIVSPRTVEALQIDRILAATEADPDKIVGDSARRYVPLEVGRIVPVWRVDDVVAEFLGGLEKLLQIPNHVTLLERVRDQFVISTGLFF